MEISEATRRDIIDSLCIENVDWAGRLDEPEFLSRIFDLKSMPSKDYRFSDAYRDIWQHRVNNPQDWEDTWVFHDSRFNLLHCEDEILLRFLCETIHPVVRSDQEEIDRLRQAYNLFLRQDGYEIVSRARMGGRSVFTARKIQLSGSVPVKALRDHLSGTDSAYIMGQITRMESAVDNDPDLAIGTSKELIETVCKTILEERGKEVPRSHDLPKLVKTTARELELTPKDIPDKTKASESIKRLLSNLATITNGVAELRNSYGTGHGKTARSKGLGTRHARLAVGAASTLAVFLYETHVDKSG